MMFGRSLAIIVVVAILAGCTFGAERPQLRGPATFCGYDRPAFVDLGVPITRQGALVPIRAMRSDAPAGDVELPPSCVAGWRVTGPARFINGHKTIQIDKKASPGAEIVLRFRFGEIPVERRFRVVPRATVVLTGTRSQRSVSGCETSQTVGEIEFTPDAFSVTFFPFESYRDYWGSYIYDPLTRRLQMSVTGGNAVPNDLDLDGTAYFENSNLVLEGMFLGSSRGPVPGQECRYIF